MKAKSTRVRVWWKERTGGEIQPENDPVTNGNLLELIIAVIWLEECLLKECASWQEKPPLCYKNGAAANLHFAHLLRLNVCRKIQLALASHFHALTQMNALT